MKTGIIIAIVAAVLVIGGIVGYSLLSKQSVPSAPSTQTNTQSAASANTPTQEGDQAISISNFAFNPSELKIKQGSTVTWTNNDGTTHTVTSDSGKELGSSGIDPGTTYSHTFNNKGTFNYHCSIHTGMKGKIVVE